MEMSKSESDISDIPEICRHGISREELTSKKDDFILLGWKRYLGLIYTLLSTNSFSLASIILKGYSHAHPFNMGTWAFPLAALISVPFIFHATKVQKISVIDSFWPIGKHKKVVFFILVRTLCSAVIPYTIILSLKYISVADMRTILAASVISIYFLGWLFLNEKCGIVPTIVVIMALCGIGVMTRPPILTGAEDFDADTMIGVSLALTSMGLATVIIVTLRYIQNVHHGVLNCFLYTYAFGQSLVLGLAFGKLKVPSSVAEWAAMSGAGVLMAVGNIFLVLALQAEEAGVVALIRTSEVIFTFFWQFVILGVAPDLISVVGAALVLAGVFVVTLRKWVASLPEEDRSRKTLNFLLR